MLVFRGVEIMICIDVVMEYLPTLQEKEQTHGHVLITWEAGGCQQMELLEQSWRGRGVSKK